jgi:hypothetical protein
MNEEVLGNELSYFDSSVGRLASQNANGIATGSNASGIGSRAGIGLDRVHGPWDESVAESTEIRNGTITAIGPSGARIGSSEGCFRTKSSVGDIHSMGGTIPAIGGHGASIGAGNSGSGAARSEVF